MKAKRYVYVLCYAHDGEDPAFVHCFVRAINEEEAYSKGQVKIDSKNPETKGFGINDYVICLEAK